MEKLTLEEVINLYGDYELKFNSYYKYSFWFEYKDENIRIKWSIWGCSEDIYRLEVDNDMKILVKNFEDELNELIIEDNWRKVFEWYDLW